MRRRTDSARYRRGTADRRSAPAPYRNAPPARARPRSRTGKRATGVLEAPSSTPATVLMNGLQARVEIRHLDCAWRIVDVLHEAAHGLRVLRRRIEVMRERRVSRLQVRTQRRLVAREQCEARGQQAQLQVLAQEVAL